MGKKGIKDTDNLKGDELFWYVIARFSKSRETSQRQFGISMGLSTTWSLIKYGGSGSLKDEHLETLFDSGELTKEEESLIIRSLEVDLSDVEQVESFIDEVDLLSFKQLREANRTNPNRIKNNPEFYKKLHEIEDIRYESRLVHVDPNDERLQELREMIGLDPIAVNPEKPMSKGIKELGPNSDRRNLADDHFAKQGRSALGTFN